MNLSERRAYLAHLEQFGIKLGLENISVLLEELGRPETTFPSVLVAGTNGKGSVASFLAGILGGQGYRAGLYSSPHLARVEERIIVGGRRIGPRRFGALLDRVKGAADRLLAAKRLSSPPTYFEALTAAAFLEFAEREVDLAVLEVGMGGRFDATNVVTPVLSVITTVSKDHQKHLGRTLRSIAFEKAGIIKPGIPVVSGVRPGPARAEIRRRAKERRAPFFETFGPATAFEGRRSRGGFRFRYETAFGRYEFSPVLAGRHQGINAAVAISAAELLARVWHVLDRERIVEGIEATRWEGRLETVSKRPRVLLDGAHNVEGATSLAAFIREVLGRPVVLVFGVMKDKDVGPMARLLFPEAARIVLTGIPSIRSARPEDVLRVAGRFRDRILVEPDVRSAVRLALAESRGRIPVVVAGSLFLVGEVKRLRLFPG
jgi:dihydrofolate synthase/folylpolyglutamate synthase